MGIRFVQLRQMLFVKEMIVICQNAVSVSCISMEMLNVMWMYNVSKRYVIRIHFAAVTIMKELDFGIKNVCIKRFKFASKIKMLSEKMISFHWNDAKYHIIENKKILL